MNSIFKKNILKFKAEGWATAGVPHYHLNEMQLDLTRDLAD